MPDPGYTRPNWAEDQVLSFRPTNVVRRESKIVHEVGIDEIAIVGGVEIDLVVERTVLERDRAFRTESAGHALDLLLDRVLAGRIGTNAPETLERSVTISFGAEFLEIIYRHCAPIEPDRDARPAHLVCSTSLTSSASCRAWICLTFKDCAWLLAALTTTIVAIIEDAAMVLIPVSRLIGLWSTRSAVLWQPADLSPLEAASRQCGSLMTDLRRCG
jgi:hypothetical protein